MAERVGRTSAPVQFGWRGLRFVRYLPDFIRLYWRLLGDQRVSIWPKALLALAVLYVLSPVDLVPDVIPFVGEIDDLVVLIAACRVFVYLCPPDVVQEHVQEIDARRAA
jgi:uncharacterized membrane protein YkvA (DUF1232 family)